MKKQDFSNIILMVVFLWAGMLLGISFLEAPLKFQAPNVTLAIGLGIGRLVFGTLNKIEILYGFTLLLLFFISKPPGTIIYYLSFVLILLCLQTLWLLPVLDARAEIIIGGGTPENNSLHLYYVIGEALKLITLITMGLKIFNEKVKSLQKN